MSNVVQYFVMKRPKHPDTGEIVRGKTRGATSNPDGSINEGATLWFPDSSTTAGPNGTRLSTTAPLSVPSKGKVEGEPWLLHSIHFSIDDAVDAAMKVVLEVGSENTRILKSISHELSLRLA